MSSFHVADLNTQGEVRSVEEYSYAALEQIPGCMELMADFSRELYPRPADFEIEFCSRDEPIVFRWAATSQTSGIATTRSGKRLLTLSVLASGISATSDRTTLDAIQSRIIRELHDSGVEPAFGFINLKERPLVATLTLADPSLSTNQVIVALADRCFAASYFRLLQLA